MLTEREQILALIEKLEMEERAYRSGIEAPDPLQLFERSQEREIILSRLKRDIERGEHLRLFPIENK